MKLLLLSNFPSQARLIGSLCAGAVMLVGSGIQAATVITPNGQASVEGNSNNAFPFSLGQDQFEVPSGTQRYQQVYSASDFTVLAAGGEFITQIAFRPDAEFGGSFSSTLPSIRIDLSTVSAAPDALSTTFADNVGADDTIVYGEVTGAPLSLSSSFTGPSGGPKDFDIIINLTTPFFTIRRWATYCSMFVTLAGARQHPLTPRLLLVTPLHVHTPRLLASGLPPPTSRIRKAWLHVSQLSFRNRAQ